MMESQWLLSLGGGMLAGLSALILMLFNGRVAGISGILAGALQHRTPGRGQFLRGPGAGAGWGFGCVSSGTAIVVNGPAAKAPEPSTLSVE